MPGESLTKKGWSLASLSACLRQADLDGRFTNQALLKKELTTIVAETKSVGKTPGNTLSKTLQDLRDLGFVDFESPGKYRMLPNKIDISILTGSGKKMSRGEKLTAQILKELNIPFEQQKTFPDLKHKGHLYFDFYIEVAGRGFVIEFDGDQHRRPVDFFGGDKGFEDTKTRDAVKNKYCKDRNIPILRVEKLDYVQLKHQIMDFLASPPIDKEEKKDEVKKEVEVEVKICQGLFKSGPKQGQPCPQKAVWAYQDKILCSRHCNIKCKARIAL